MGGFMPKRVLAARQEAEQLLIWEPLSAGIRVGWGLPVTVGVGDSEMLLASDGPLTEPTAMAGNVVGVGVREKITAGRLTGQPCVAVYVVHKLPDLAVEGPLVPKEIEGVATDVIESGEFVTLSAREHHRPAMSGISVGHYSGTTGTLGFFARRGTSHEVYAVGCNHVLACLNKARKGDAVLQPSAHDGGVDDQFGRLDGWEELRFDWRRILRPNRIDAALVEVDAWQTSTTIFGAGPINPNPLDPREHLPVMKSGRSTGLTHGIVTDPMVTAKVRHGLQTGVMRKQMIIEPSGGDQYFSKRGDSGSLVVEAGTLRPVGMICGGSAQYRYSIANRITYVLEILGVSLQR
ncbi:hypothetical protein [Streptomyces lavendulocolor]|uniref:hypothetical protein n=1 Tax=Streptomyces lavendulocolor TaxID=67316 RepID=UPI0033FC7919